MSDVTTATPSVTPPPSQQKGKTVLIVCGCLGLASLVFIGSAVVAGYWYYQSYQDNSYDVSGDDLVNNINTNSVTKSYKTNPAYGDDTNTEDSDIAEDQPSNTNATVGGGEATILYADLQDLMAAKGYNMTYNETKINDLMTYSGFTDDSVNYFSVIETDNAAPLMSVTTRQEGSGPMDPTFLEDVVYDLQPNLAEQDWIAENIAAAEADIKNNAQTLTQDDRYYIFSYNTMEINDQTITAATVSISPQY